MRVLVCVCACARTRESVSVSTTPSNLVAEGLGQVALRNTSLLLNNLAAQGDTHAVSVLSGHGMLMRELAAWLDNAHDAATLQRLTGVFNHLSRSVVRHAWMHA